MQTIYLGTILTMETPLYAQALLVENGIIRAVGAADEILSHKTAQTQVIELGERVLLPGFIDAHSHITSYAATFGLCPLAGVKSFSQLEQRLRAFCEEKRRKPGEWIAGFGYDHNFLAEGRHPTRELLDKACPDNPVLLAHASGHMGVMNSLALRLTGLAATTPDPPGGKIGREPGSQEPSGYLEETAFTTYSAALPKPSLSQQLDNLEQAQRSYLRYGITTVQDGYTQRPEWELLKAMDEQERLVVDVISYADLKENHALMQEGKAYEAKGRRLHMGGYKIFLDGSPQGRTAWMSTPYQGDEMGYCGYPIYQDKQVIEFLQTALQEGQQILVHCNGDAAAQQLIDCYAKAKANLPASPDIRPVMIHAQLVREDQLARMASYGMIASFFVSHTYHWGDIHLQNFGEARAMRISPVQSAIQHGVLYTFHQDTPVLAPDVFESLWCAVNRVTRNGVVLGAQQCITALEALRGVTVYAAYQYFEEHRKGSLAPGKIADLVILDRDPLKMPPAALRELRVLETIKRGETVFAQ